ncbi:uncharacterized protein LOC123904227 [Trifolium pratense]|uniref:uncharacterized protein LOC123904227 n=1 Tax=Trifolium pratense TaxID=57577 RepID=UPI001E6924F9|nr:uncharacterized protein LOC123904227 [Trifolium pratense]
MLYLFVFFFVAFFFVVGEDVVVIVDGVLFHRSSVVKLSGMSERAYIKSIMLKLDVRELAIQFGCVRIIPYVRYGLKLIIMQSFLILAWQGIAKIVVIVGHLTTNSDVYSFGVVLLEILTESKFRPNMNEVVRTLEKLQVPNLNVGNLKHADGQSPNLLSCIHDSFWLLMKNIGQDFFSVIIMRNKQHLKLIWNMIQSPVFMAVAFYLCAKKHKLKVDKIKLIELCGTSEAEFSSVSTTMKDLCHDVFGVAKEKKDPKEVKTNRDLLDVLPSKRKAEDGSYLSDDGAETSYSW